MAAYQFAITITDAMEEEDITEAFRLLRAEIGTARKVAPGFRAG